MLGMEDHFQEVNYQGMIGQSIRSVLKRNRNMFENFNTGKKDSISEELGEIKAIRVVKESSRVLKQHIASTGNASKKNSVCLLDIILL